MPRWKKDAKEFTVGVNYNEKRGYQCSIPRPVMEVLGEPEAVTFILDNKQVKIKSG